MRVFYYGIGVINLLFAAIVWFNLGYFISTVGYVVAAGLSILFGIKYGNKELKSLFPGAYLLYVGGLLLILAGWFLPILRFAGFFSNFPFTGPGAVFIGILLLGISLVPKSS